jgi:hypothetical protein
MSTPRNEAVHLTAKAAADAVLAVVFSIGSLSLAV